MACLGAFAVLEGCHMEALAEAAVEVGEVGEAGA